MNDERFRAEQLLTLSSGARRLADLIAAAEGPVRYEVLIRPGPRMGEAALLIADCLAKLPSAPVR